MPEGLGRWIVYPLVGVRPTRVYVALDGCAVDLKVYSLDLARTHGTAYRDDRQVAMLPAATTAGAPAFVMGDLVEAQARAWDAERARFVIDLRPVPRKD